MNSIEVNNFTKKFGGFVAVDNISFDVKEGSIFAFLGPNGAGKSTTIKTLCTIQDISSGELKINGNDVSSEKDKVRKDIGIVFQESTLDGKLTVKENLKLHCDFYDVPKEMVKERIKYALELVDLTNKANEFVASLSGGMKRRVEIARGLVHYPKVLFLDEPTTGLDPQTRANVWDYIQRLKKEKNITIFLTTHYMDEAEICDKVAIIDHGKVVAYDTPYNLKRKYTSSKLKIVTKRKEELVYFLSKYELNYKIENECVIAYTSDVKKVLDVISEFSEMIEDIEINKGTLNDVFIAITGKEIRE
jgi:ABC-2 type transport system ATP-binding protein